MNDLLSSLDGLFRIRCFENFEKLPSNILYFNEKPVQSFCWIAPWTLTSILPNGNKYYQIDASFYALYPYVYFVPLLIINNAPLPLGLVLGPSEHSYLFIEFFKYLILLENNHALIPSNKYPILSGQGQAIISFAQN